MKSSFAALSTLIIAACSLVAAAPATESGASRVGLANVNPYTGYEVFNSPVWKPKVLSAADSFTKQGKTALATKARKVAEVPTFMWISKTADISSLPGWLSSARALQTQTGKKQLVQIVVYNLPDRDCSAKASDGELSYANGGKAKYEAFIQSIRGHLANYADVRVVVQLETDAIGNFVTGSGYPKCAQNAAAQKQSYAYAVANLQLDNVALYLDGAGAGWLGYSESLGPAATILTSIIAEAKKLNSATVVRGISTNVSGYSGYNDSSLSQYNDELKYINNLVPLLAAKGWNAKFIVDQGRSGNQKVARDGWCNFKFAGFGKRPTTSTSSSNVDAIVWVKPAGESDGTTDRASARFDETCVSSTSIIPMPEAGDWSEAAFEITLNNANPAF